MLDTDTKPLPDGLKIKDAQQGHLTGTISALLCSVFCEAAKLALGRDKDNFADSTSTPTRNILGGSIKKKR